MTPEELTNRTNRAFVRMNEIYGCPVFDEWALVVVSGGKGQVLHYEGPRSDAFAEAFPRDVALLREQFEARDYFTGEFEFTADGHGTLFDAFVKVSDTVYLICNNTRVAMTRIRGNSQWLKAQVPFAGLCAQISNATFQKIEVGSL
jgi:hypothetical protein